MTKVVRIFWKRTYLFVEYVSSEPKEIYLKSDEGCFVFFNQKKLEGDLFRAKLNLCIAQGREMLGQGEWNLQVKDGYTLSDNVMLNLELLSNVFRYDENKAYIVTFHLEELEKEELLIKLQVDYMVKNPCPKRRFDRLFLLKMGLNCWYQMFSRLSRKKGNKILFLSENREDMNGNLKAIYDRMLERRLDEQYKLNKSICNIFIEKQSPIYWLCTVSKIAMHDFIFVEDYVPILGFLKLDKSTTVVQTWHAGFGFKSVGYGRFGLKGSPNPFHSCHRNYTYALVGNEYLKEIYSEVFGIEESSLLPTGMPRLSCFLNDDVIKKSREILYEKMPFLQNKRVITFAPTYRGSNQKEAYYDMNRIDQEQLYDFCEKNNSVVLFKFHPFLKGKHLVNEKYEKNLIDLSDYNINDLFYITDVLITDYSSCFYDYILLKKPVLFYVYDEELYSATRGVHRPVSKVAPGKICKSFPELMDALEQTDYEFVEIPDFMIDRCSKHEEMTASDKVIDYVILGEKDISL